MTVESKDIEKLTVDEIEKDISRVLAKFVLQKEVYDALLSEGGCGSLDFFNPFLNENSFNLLFSKLLNSTCKCNLMKVV